MANHELNRLRDELAPVLAGKGYEPVDMRWTSEAGRRILRVSIAHMSASGEQGTQGITVNDCAVASRLIEPILDLAGIKGRYYLEVSSPGIGPGIK